MRGSLTLGETVNCSKQGALCLGDRPWEIVCSSLTRVIMSHHKRNSSAIHLWHCFILKIFSVLYLKYFLFYIKNSRLPAYSVQPAGLYKSAWLYDSAPSALNFFASLFEALTNLVVSREGLRTESIVFGL